CDVFIAVSAGAAGAQFQMESLAPIVLQQTQNSPVKTRLATSDPHLSPGVTSAPQALAPSLFALPATPSTDQSEPGQSACSDAGERTTSSAVDPGSRSCDPIPTQLPIAAESPQPSPPLDDRSASDALNDHVLNNDVPKNDLRTNDPAAAPPSAEVKQDVKPPQHDNGKAASPQPVVDPDPP
ncbi:MAG TPA: hypothetical protein VJX30_06510, partial [Terriglobales bacterium]|nr:hypothetical protein [Terriglobales bacterium]